MKVSEKSLELNVGAELLWQLRNVWGLPKAYLRGLTQDEERREGVDFFAQLDPATRIYAFQFKAPQGSVEGTSYRYKLVKYQHDELHRLGAANPGCVFYVFPFYVTPKKLHTDVPNLLDGTWLLDVEPMVPATVFGLKKTTTISCTPGRARVNPEYRLVQFGGVPTSDAPAEDHGERQGGRGAASELSPPNLPQPSEDVTGGDLRSRLIEPGRGLSPVQFAEWYLHFRTLRQNRDRIAASPRRSSWLSRGLRVMIVPPSMQQRV